MPLAIVTRADENIQEITRITHPLIKRYAKKCAADFIILNDIPSIQTYDNRPHYRILKVYDLFEKYDRILLLDSDIIINKECPNLFNVVPVDKIGTIFEDKGTRTENRHNRIKSIQELFGDISWRTGYSNAGTFMVSEMHKDIFTPINGKYYTSEGSVDVHLGYQIRKKGYEIFELLYQFNHMTIFSEKWNGAPSRFNSYIIHYAGKGIFNKKKRLRRFKTKLQQIKYDYEKIYGKK